jgi:hypothetical protein
MWAVAGGRTRGLPVLRRAQRGLRRRAVWLCGLGPVRSGHGPLRSSGRPRRPRTRQFAARRYGDGDAGDFDGRHGGARYLHADRRPDQPKTLGVVESSLEATHARTGLLTLSVC